MKILAFLFLAAGFAALMLGAVACVNNSITGPDCHAAADAAGGGGGAGSATGEGGPGSPGSAHGDAGCTGGKIASQ